MVLKRIIRQFLNQHFPENIKPGQRFDRKAKKILQNQNYFRYIPLLKRIKRAQSYLKNSQIYSLNENINQLKYKYKQNLRKTKYDPFLKYIERCSTLIKKLDKSSIHYKTELCRDEIRNNFSCNLKFILKSSNQWTGLHINWLTLPSNFYKLQRARYYLYTLNQYKVGFGRKYDRRDPSSIYKSQLMERKKLGLLYGNLSKKEIYRTIQRAEKYRGVLRENVFRVLESRLDVILYRIGFFKTIPSARQWIIHRKILVNQQVVTIAHYQVKAGDVISVDRVESAILKQLITRRFSARKKLKSYRSRQKTVWPFVANRKVLKKIIKKIIKLKFEIFLNYLKKLLLRATKNIIQKKCKQPGLARTWKRLRRYKIFLQRQQNRSTSPKRKRHVKKQQTNCTIFIQDKKNRYKKQKLHNWLGLRWDKKIVSFQKKKRKAFFVNFESRKQLSKLEEQKKNLSVCFETIKELIKIKRIESLTRKEYGKKLSDPLFTYKCLILLKKTAAPFFSPYTKKTRTFRSIKKPFTTKDPTFRGIKKPLHLEISYQTLTAIYLYSPQKIFFPVNLDIDGVKKSYY